jgi:serine/threonine-protein kinase RsbW
MVTRGADAWPSSASTVRVPAHPDFVSSIRSMTRAMAVLADLTLDDVEELQMAVDEAAILLLPLVGEAPYVGGEPFLVADFEVQDGCLGVVLSAPCADGSVVDRTGLPWVMLSAIDPDVTVRTGEDTVAIAITRRREGLRQ